ncbi:MAG: sensor histidine kinase [Rubrobacteridae bacterium]|nr:sensor histidine kinase [Rubrobacteridae bacterium]
MLEEVKRVTLVFGTENDEAKPVRRLIEKTVYDTTYLIERERKRLAYDLHDGPAQAISSAILQVDILEDLIASAEGRRELESLKEILKQSLHELRVSIYALKPHETFKKGFAARIEAYARHFSILTGIEVVCRMTAADKRLPEIIEINAFRVIQEALNNSRKHAKASMVTISVSISSIGVSCSMEDNGKGFNVSDCETDGNGLGGYGLLSMKDRVEQLGGSIEIESKLSAGTRISFIIPLPVEESYYR